MAAAFRDGAARLAIVGDDPNLLSGQDPGKVARANRARSIAYRPALELITNSAINWTIVACATPAWAHAVFPALPEAAAMAALWDAIFAASRVATDDPIAGWAAHNATLMARRNMLNAKRYAALHYRGPGTDLRVGLADRAPLDGRPDHRGERHHRQPEHPDRGGVHHAALPAHGGHRRQPPCRCPTRAR